MRQHYWQYLLNTEGQPIQGASISIFEAGTDIPIYVYSQEVGGTPTNTSPQITTGLDGYFEFWVADAADTVYGYSGIKLKIQWSKTGINTAYIDNVDFTTSLSGNLTFNEIICASSVTLVSAQVSNTVLNNYGQAGNVNVILPPAAQGLSFSAILGTTAPFYFRLTPYAADSVYLVTSFGGAPTTAGAGIYVGVASAALGNSIIFKTFQTGSNKWNWYAVVVSGTWVT